MTAPILPLCNAEELRAELDAIDRDLDAMCQRRIVDRERLDESRERLFRWRDRILDQLSRMEAAV